MLKNVRVFVLVKLYHYYGELTSRYAEEVKNCSMDDKKFGRLMKKLCNASCKQVSVLDKLYALRD